MPLELIATLIHDDRRLHSKKKRETNLGWGHVMLDTGEFYSLFNRKEENYFKTIPAALKHIERMFIHNNISHDKFCGTVLITEKTLKDGAKRYSILPNPDISEDYEYQFNKLDTDNPKVYRLKLEIVDDN